MAIRFIEQAWKTLLDTASSFQQDGGHLERFYIGPRPDDYPPLAGSSLAYTLIAAGDNQPGSHNVTGGHADYFVDLQQPSTLHVRFKPTFGYAVATDQPLAAWRVDTTHALTLFYSAANDRYTVAWQDGGTQRVLEGPVHSSDGTLQVWTDIDIVFDRSSPVLLIDGTVVDSAWSGAADALASSFPTFSLRHDGTGIEGGYVVNHVRLFLGVAIATARVQSLYRDVWDEELHWPLDGHGLGRPRCNVSDRVKEYALKRDAKKKKTGVSCANVIDLRLRNSLGLFSDNQYAAYDPGNRQYNGTTDQRFLQSRCRITAESWYGRKHEPFFVGRVNEKLLKRKTFLTQSTVSVTAEDAVSDMVRVEAVEGLSWEDVQLCDPNDEANSLLHLLVRRGSQVAVENLLANSGFENATIANSWVVSGTGATLSRAAGGLRGSYEGQLVYGSADAELAQTVTFLDKTVLNVGERYVLAIWLKAPVNATVDVVLEERDSGGVNSTFTYPGTVVGGAGWQRMWISGAIADSDSDRLKVWFVLKTNTTLSLDCAMLSRGLEPVNWDVLNADDGAAGVTIADAMEIGRYDTLGFDVDEVEDIHPWAVPEEPWETLLDLADATAAWIMGIDSAGTFRFRSPFKPSYADPAPIGTLSSTWELASEIDDEQANSVVVRGIKIIKDTAVREVWNAIDSQEKVGGVSLTFHVLAAGGIYPEPTLWPDFWAKYESIVVTTKKTHKWWQWHSRTKLIRTKPNDKDAEVIGVKTPSLVYSCTRPVAYPHWNPSQLPLTQVLFDTTSRIDQAQFRLRNDNGFSTMCWGSSIRGKLVQRYSGDKGYVHDKFRDPDAIRADGETQLEIENNLIVSQDQCNRIAAFGWKDARPKKHAFSFPQSGAALYLEPGDWYTLQIGGPGRVEYVNSSVTLESVEIHRTATGRGQTKIDAREVQENWTYDSTAFARSVATGRYEGGRQSLIIVAASKYMGPASYYCTEIANHEVINAALREGKATGRAVQLTPGTFYCSGKITVPSNVTVLGSGESTLIYSTGNETIFEYEQDGVGIVVDSLKMQNGETVNYAKLAVKFNGAIKSTLRRCVIVFATCAGVMCDGDFNKLIDNTCEGGRPAAAFSILDTETFSTNRAVRSQVAKLDDTHYVIAYDDNSDGEKVKAVVVTVTNGTIAYGTPVATPTAMYGGDHMDVMRLDDTHFLLAWLNSASNAVKAMVGVVSSGDVVTFPGTEYTVMATAANSQELTLIDSTHSVLLMTENSTSYGIGYVITWTAGTTTLAFGAKQTWRSGWTFTPRADLITGTSTLFTMYYDATNGTYGVVLTVNTGTGAITAATAAIILSSASSTSDFDGKVVSATLAIATYRDVTDGNKLKTKTVAISGTSLTVASSAVTVTSYGVYNPRFGRVSDTEFVITEYSGTATEAILLRLYGTGVTVATIGTIYSGSGGGASEPVLMTGGQFAVAFVEPSGGVAYHGLTSLFEFTVAPDAVSVYGDSNIVQGTHVVGLSGYTVGSGFYVAGNDNKVVDNVVDGMVSADRKVEAGLVVASGARNIVSNNTLKNCSVKGFVDAGDATLLSGTNMAYNNGADTGVVTF